jgi:hypothetical protein
MRKLAGTVIVVLLAVAIYAFYPRAHAPSSAPAAAPESTPDPAPKVAPPRLAPVPMLRDAGSDLQIGAVGEANLMRELRDNVKSNPELAESLARDGRRRFPDSAESDERDALLVDALINQQRIGAARSETYYYFDHHPNGRFGEHLFVMTGVHPTPKAPGQP